MAMCFMSWTSECARLWYHQSTPAKHTQPGSRRRPGTCATTGGLPSLDIGVLRGARCVNAPSARRWVSLRPVRTSSLTTTASQKSVDDTGP